MQEQQYALEIKDLKGAYRVDEEIVHALNGISFTLEKGGTIGLVGETCAGKTTTGLSNLRLIPSPAGKAAGTVLVQGRDISKLSDLSVVQHFSDDIAVMYLGKIIELAPSDELFAHPTHPYTQALLSAIPVPKLEGRRERIILRGEIVSPVNLPKACRFAARCNNACERCHAEEPELKEISPGHWVSCFECK